MKNWLGENGSAFGVSKASFPLIESNNLEAVGRTGVVYWNWVVELGDSRHCKTNGHSRARKRENMRSKTRKTTKGDICLTNSGIRVLMLIKEE